VGLTTGDLEEAYIKRALSSSAAETHVLLTAEKINAASPYLIAPLSDIDGIVVDGSVGRDLLDPYERMGLSIVRA
jgi:DeoR/GlpR family transcriptional regulator of sugar metabolism